MNCILLTYSAFIEHMGHINMSIIIFFLVTILFSALVVLGFELRAVSLVGRCSISWATPLALFALAILEIRSYFLPRLCWAMIFLFYASCCYWLTWGLVNFLPGLALNFGPPDLSLPSRQYYRYEPLELINNTSLSEVEEFVKICGGH
jgi:hypothetical protein